MTHRNMSTQPARIAPDAPPLGFREFVALVAALMALTALGIDSMLPALPAIGDALGVKTANERQLVITAFLIGFGVAQLAHGPLADRFGRKPVLGVALAAYVIANFVAAFSASFELLLIARFIGGTAIAASRVVTVALVRDCYSGRAMARVMSLAFIVFMAAPVLAPTVGQTILLFGSWRLIFAMIGVISAGVLLWFWMRMPETLHPIDRMPLSFRRLAGGWRMTITDRWSLGYTLASTALMGALYGFINSVQQIVFDVFDAPKLLVLVFAITASTMAVANFLNSRIVMVVGTRRISHSALVGLILLSGLHLVVALAGWETLATFAVIQALTMGCFGLATSNFSAMAMENMGAIAGTASSVQGFTTVTVGALIGAGIGQAFDGTTVPLFLGFFVAGLIALAIVALVERGRLFRPT
ncbi:DHA1 family bicyclomycin/chloramphenicol resistance-like MFS transporter [Hephaestia caeni]|uniref:Bcr/CflA family efflux transporter n=1 Tax=Hephaestia caeni TaxID=645617 RepID=A0A397NJE5_9SPHN|nr:multidrug effflux MFS transporter [Hephaestia caeni]RIA37656.1 DHA1 family bicyclomycin/chloramphenicol resistance-like MFS transporter [Hephaestia caeni]